VHPRRRVSQRLIAFIGSHPVAPKKGPSSPTGNRQSWARAANTAVRMSKRGPATPAGCHPGGLARPFRANFGPKRNDFWRFQAISPDPSGTHNFVGLLCKSAIRFSFRSVSNPAGVAESLIIVEC
jgi:hypothetical protein